MKDCMHELRERDESMLLKCWLPFTKEGKVKQVLVGWGLGGITISVLDTFHVRCQVRRQVTLIRHTGGDKSGVEGEIQA